jgi:hypothetical protein
MPGSMRHWGYDMGLCYRDWRALDDKLNLILSKLKVIINQGANIMATLSDLQAAVTAEDTVIDSAITLLNGLAAQVAALQPNQAAIDALAADISAKTAQLANAVTANTPNPPAPATVPVVPPTA